MIRSVVAGGILTVLLALAFLNLRVMNYATLPVHRCVAWQAEMRAQAAEVVFVGTSRTGAGIDPEYIASALSQSLETQIEVDRLITWRSDLVHLNLMLREYLTERGAPQIVIIELTYLPVYERGRQDLNALTLEPRSYHFAEPKHLKALMSELGTDGSGLLDRAYQVASIAAFASNKLAISLYHLVRQPFGLLIDTADLCSKERRMKTEGAKAGLVFGSVGSADPLSAPPFSATPTGEPPLEDDAYTRPYESNLYENRLFENTIQLLQKAGVRQVILARIAPSPNSPLKDAASIGIPKMTGNVRFVDVAAEMSEERRKRISLQYRDKVHLTLVGARDLSDFFSGFLIDALQNQ